MFCRYRSSPCLKVPRTLIYIISGDKAIVRKITTRRELGENIEVLSGLQEGNEVVVNEQINLANGIRITKLVSNK